MVGGQASAIYLAGWTMDQMAIRRNAAMVIDWPEIETRTFDMSTFTMKDKPFTEAKKDYEKHVDQLTDWFEQSRHYAQALEKAPPGSFERDVKLEAMVPVIRGQMPVLVFADNARDIRNAVEFCEAQKLQDDPGRRHRSREGQGSPAFQKYSGNFAANIGGSSEEDDAYDRLMTQPAELTAAGIRSRLEASTTALLAV